MYKKASCTCSVVVLLIKPIVFRRSRGRRRRGFVRSLILGSFSNCYDDDDDDDEDDDNFKKQ